MKHLIIEGMDGSGKDTLINHLTRYPGFSDYLMHPRASTSLGGPVSNLVQWVERDIDRLAHDDIDHAWIYNRHPLISERIYGYWRPPDRPIADGFERGHQWWDNAARWMGAHSILVIVQPPFGVVDQILRTQGAQAHMPGVYQNRLSLYADYAAFQWPGKTIRYDRTRASVGDLVKTIHLASE